MPDIIRLLPEATANMIAAGEVVQRPASVVKELLENSIDAGASHIQLIIADGGQTLIQVIDNGKGMTETDARMCWERHATSKINRADDLFKLNTFGFRGEAMASIAAVSKVEMKTRTATDDLGTYILIEASEVKTQEPVQCPVGTSVSVKNLFYNIPARRNFLKSVSVETRHIIDEFQRVALPYPAVSFSLINNGAELFNLPSADVKTRIAQVLNLQSNTELLPLNEHTNFVAIHGFTGSPALAKRTRGEQFFFVNGRFIKDPYFNHAVVGAYEGLIENEQFPAYVIFLEIEPSRVDVNVHPSKTEVKFEDSRDIYAVLKSVVKKALGGYNLSEESTDEFIFNPVKSGHELTSDSFWPKEPRINVNPDFNPFGVSGKKKTPTQWEKLYEPFREASSESRNLEMELPDKPAEEFTVLQIASTWLAVTRNNELYLVHQQHAHERILYEKYTAAGGNRSMPSQQLLFPRSIALNHADAALLLDIIEDINKLGFDISHFGKQDFIVNGIPPDMQKVDVQAVIEQLLDHFKMEQKQLQLTKRDALMRSMARHAAIPAGRMLSATEASALINELFHCSEPAFTPFGKPVFIKFAPQRIEQLFNS